MNIAVVRIHNAFADRETQARAADAAGTLDAVEFIENTLQVFGRNTRAVIIHADVQKMLITPGR